MKQKQKEINSIEIALEMHAPTQTLKKSVLNCIMILFISVMAFNLLLIMCGD